MPKILKEPLIHFLGGALLVFGFFWATGTNRDPADYTISVDQSNIDRLRAGWIQNFRRPPTQQELDALIDQEVTEEIYYREALRLGLDRNDAVIRRRMFTKMRFLNNQDSAASEPNDTELQQWIRQNQGKYSLSATYDLEQIYLGQGGTLSETEVVKLLQDLNSGAVEASDISKPISLPQKLMSADNRSISRQFGEQFSVDLAEQETGKWVGPVTSGFGEHLIYIMSKTPGKPAMLDDVRQAVTNDWRAAQTAQQEETALEQYRSQYDIRVAGRE
ncbi:MAG: peptidylprolyl isomerase [Parasphingorhabdus sp.]